jgi:uncharacterized membrane protein
MPIGHLLLLAATLLCGLTTGLVFAFMIVVMPGIRTLPDREFLRAFKVMDRIIQNNSPLFLLAWAGSMIFLIAAGIMNVTVLSGIPRLLLIGAVAAYLVGVQAPTFAVNVPLNNQLQALDLPSLDAAALREARAAFASRWVYWNTFRTVFGLLTTVLLLVVIYLA